MPAIAVFVRVAGGKDQPRISTSSGAGGRFELLGVTEDMGVVELFTIVASYNWGNPEARLGASRPVSVRAGDTDVLLELRELVSMTGKVEDADGQPVEGVQVLAYLNGSAHVRSAVLTRDTSDEQGAFSLELPDDSLVDLVADPPKVDKDAEPSEEAPPKPAELNSLASGAQGVLLRFAK